MRLAWLTFLGCVAALSACATASPPADGRAPGLPTCRAEPLRATHLEPLPAAHDSPDTWLSSLPDGAGDRVLMSAEQIAALNDRNRQDTWGFQDVLSAEVAAPERVSRELKERYDWLAEKLASGAYLEQKKATLQRAWQIVEKAEVSWEARIVAKETDLRCVPSHEGFFTAPVDPDFDRNQCSRLHLGEPVRVLRVSADGHWRYVHAGHSVGWVAGDVLTPPLLVEEVQAFRAPEAQLFVTRDGVSLPDGQALRMGTRLPLLGRSQGGLQVALPTPQGLSPMVLEGRDELHEGPLPFTRKNVWRLALATLGDPYGWGGRAGGRDCSRLLLDLFRVFGIELGRHSLAQARGGVRTVELEGLDEAAKTRAIREAVRDNIVFLYMSGHIMLYLGEKDGVPYAVSAISEIVRPCDGEGDQVVRIDRTVVSDLEVGRHTERTSFIERMKRLAVFGP